MLRIVLLISGAWLMLACGNKAGGNELSAGEFYAKLQSTPAAVVLDVRTASEFGEEGIEGAVNMDVRSADFEKAVASLDREKTYFVYCLSGGRSKEAAEILRKQGHREVYELKGGLLQWKAESLPLRGNATVNKPVKGMTPEAYMELTTSHDQVMVDFYAPWCKPCAMMKPHLERLEQKQGSNMKLVRIDIDENPDLADYLSIYAIPEIRIYRKGEEVWKHVGYADEELLESQLK